LGSDGRTKPTDGSPVAAPLALTLGLTRAAAGALPPSPTNVTIAITNMKPPASATTPLMIGIEASHTTLGCRAQ
jgi:hypothetical protein